MTRGHVTQPYEVIVLRADVTDVAARIYYVEELNILASRLASGVARRCGGCGPHRAALARGGKLAENVKKTRENAGYS